MTVFLPTDDQDYTLQKRLASLAYTGIDYSTPGLPRICKASLIVKDKVFICDRHGMSGSYLNKSVNRNRWGYLLSKIRAILETISHTARTGHKDKSNISFKDP